MIVLGLMVGAVWGAASVELKGKTPIGHALAWWKKQDFLASWTDKKPAKPAQKKPAKKREAAKPIVKEPTAPVEKEATAKRVALLERAAQAIERDDGNPGAKTEIDEKPSASEKKALDELLTSRVPRGR